jgi:hypothetical protein
MSCFLYTNNEQIDKEYRQRISFIIGQKNKYLGVNLMKDADDLFK